MRQGACTKGCVCALDSYINPSFLFVCLFDLTPFIGVGFVYVCVCVSMLTVKMFLVSMKTMSFACGVDTFLL